jgi:hypothetical protein
MATQNPKISIYDHSTGKTVVREMNNDELADYEAGLEATAKAEAAKTKLQLDREALLQRLGITEDEAKLLLA